MVDEKGTLFIDSSSRITLDNLIFKLNLGINEGN